MRTGLFLALILFLSCQATYAQTVSIITTTSGPDSVTAEAAMKRYLRAEGYTVKSDTNEGIVLMLSVTRPATRLGESYGLVGHVTVVSVNWQTFADLAVSESCKEDHTRAQRIKDYLGTRVIYHTDAMAYGPDADSLAEMLVTGRVNTAIRETSRKILLFLDEIEKAKTEESKDVINPYR